MDKLLETELWTSNTSMLRVTTATHLLATQHAHSGQPLSGGLLAGLIIAVFALMALTLFGFVSYSFGHGILSIFRRFHARHVVRFGSEGLATLVAKRSSLMTPRGGPLTLIVTLEFTSPDGIVHRREFSKYADVANLPAVGSRYKVSYDPAHPDDFVMKDSWIR